MSRKKYRITGPNAGGHPVGTICYDCAGHDYGLANDDTRMTGHPHVSKTLDPQGGYPSFTIRTTFLEEVTDEST
jgi:hypothetical protein